MKKLFVIDTNVVLFDHTCIYNFQEHDVALSVHAFDSGAPRLICHQCNRSRPVPAKCDECGRPLTQTRAGTQRVEREVQSLFPAARVVRWDRDTARTADQHEAIMGRFMRGTFR